jgi:hypothetical protein
VPIRRPPRRAAGASLQAPGRKRLNPILDCLEARLRALEGQSSPAAAPTAAERTQRVGGLMVTLDEVLVLAERFRANLTVRSETPGKTGVRLLGDKGPGSGSALLDIQGREYYPTLITMAGRSHRLSVNVTLTDQQTVHASLDFPRRPEAKTWRRLTVRLLSGRELHRLVFDNSVGF